MSNNNNAIPSPEEWLESNEFPFPDSMEDVINAMKAYAAHVAALVHRNTRHLAGEIVATEGGGNGTQCAQSNARMYNSIMNMPLRAVYPVLAGEENREEGKKITFYEVYDFRAMYDRESAVCYESMIDTLEEAKKAAEGYGGGVIYECTGEVDDTATPHTITETSARKKMQVIPK